MTNKKDLTGKRFGMFVVIQEAEERSKSGDVCWECVCDCGVTTIVQGKNLRSGNSKSCGCIRPELTAKLRYKHGQTNSSAYKSWSGMKDRCYNKNNRAYPRYGGRGITVCERWFNSFQDFLQDMGPSPSPKHSIDRIDNNQGYRPDNCRWATRKEQCRNRRTNRILAHEGESKTVIEWSEETGLNKRTILTRLTRGWTVRATLTTPARSRGEC